MKTTITTIKHNEWKPHNYKQNRKQTPKKTSTQNWYFKNIVELSCCMADSRSQNDVFAPWVCWQLDLTSISKPPGSRHTFPRVVHKIWGWAVSIRFAEIFGLAEIFDLLKEFELPDFVFFMFFAWGREKSFSINRILLLLLNTIFWCG